jgi:NADPH-dependent ferric siderophore reductase
MSQQTAAQPPVRHKGPLKVRVVRSEQITPHLKRITLSSEDLVGYPFKRAGAHIKVFLQRPGQAELTLPELTDNGPVWPPKELRPFTRTYTIRAYRPASNEIDIDFVLHGDNGPASAWASHAQVGDTIGITVPGRHEEGIYQADWVLLVGDLSALPAISAYLEALPSSTRGYAFIEVPSAEDQQEIVTQSQVELVWRYQNGVQPSQSRQLLEAVKQIEWPQSANTFTYLVGESHSVLAIRQHLLQERGLDRQKMYIVPFWKDKFDEEAYHDERHRIMDDEE